MHTMVPMQPSLGGVAARRIVVHAVGDVRLRAEAHHLAFDHVRAALRKSDVVFGNCESSYGDVATVGHACDRDCPVGTLQRAGFSVMSCANNRFGDEGPDAALSTLNAFVLHDIATCGSGRTPSRAWGAAVLRVKGKRLGFLAFTAVRDQLGKADIPEIANVHAQSRYVDVEANQPGTPPLILTETEPRDLTRVVEAVATAREVVDHLFVSFHWGIHLIPFVIADYERELAHAVVDAGADGVFGHHQHVLKPIEWYQGRPIFYGLGNFASFVSPTRRSPHSRDPSEAARRYGEYRSRHYRGTWNTRPPHLRFTVIARSIVGNDEPTRVELVPCAFDRRNRPVAVPAGSPTGRRVLDYLREACDVAGVSTAFSISDRGRYIAVT